MPKNNQVYISTLKPKAQLTVPVEICRAFNLQAGDQVSFEVLKDGSLKVQIVQDLKITPAKASKEYIPT